MPKINMTNNYAIWESDNGQERILDFTDFCSNNSSIPFQAMKEDTYNLPCFLADSIKEMFGKLAASKHTQGFAYFLTITHMMQKALQRHRALKVLEIGCSDGILSCFLAKTLHFFNPENTLYCVADTMYTGESEWLQNIDETGEAVEGVNLIVSDFAAPILRSDFFDIVIINGYTEFYLPEDVIVQCIRMIKESGVLMCITHDQPLLYSSFQIFTDACYEYSVGNNEFFMIKKNITSQEKQFALSHIPECMKGKRKLDCAAGFSAIYPDLLYLGNKSEQEMRTMLKQVEEIEHTVIEIYDELENVEVKFQISEFKEALCRCLLADSEREKQYYLSTSICKYNAVCIE